MSLAEVPARITISEIAVTLSIGKYAVYRALEARTIPGVRFGNRWMVSRMAFHRWLETCGESAKVGVQ
jgi:excisionase family DNA binding protein